MPDRLERPAVDAEAAWQRVGEDVLAGVCHTLNSRLTSLWGVAELLATEEAGASLVELLRSELARLERLARLLQWLPRRPGRAAVPVSLADLLPELVELHQEHREFDRIRVELEGDPRTPAVLADPAALGRAVLLLLAAAARAALGPHGRISAAYGRAGGAAAFTIRVSGAAPSVDGDAAAFPEVEAARRYLDGAAEISVERGGGDHDPALSFALRLPAL